MNRSISQISLSVEDQPVAWLKYFNSGT